MDALPSIEAARDAGVNDGDSPAYFFAFIGSFTAGKVWNSTL
jgi:hypothetical protein